MPSQGVVDREGEEAELDGVVREQSRVLLAPHPETLLFPQLNLVKSWGSSQVYAQTPRDNIMKWLVLQLLTLYCLGILPASGNWKERIDSLVEFPIYIFPKLKLKPCPKIPTDEHCVTNCQLHSECQIGHRCCRAFCGNVCMLLKETGSSSRNNKISNMVSTVEPLNRQ
ncbi:WAP four-disulfide core domain protein 13-like isoform X1 [Equus quagga]|uniref:WAP four-disulfide core domain protein 13-like isoform X1 n=1 Tax=Equus quagga TaxID=89248 RepID=UPI001EE2166F|nr:WAP four-disulfide core domain protein 13-like isoform X1 [Equus quagga]